MINVIRRLLPSEATKFRDLIREFTRKQQPSHFTPEELLEYLLKMVTPIGIQASDYFLFKGAVFGRDSERVALDLLPWYPSLTEVVILSLARLQGTKNDSTSEEEPGKIPHEYRSLYIDGQKIAKEQEELLVSIAERFGWSKEKEEICYFGSVDATPQFVRLVFGYYQRYGKSILDKKIANKNGQVFSLKDCVLQAIHWTAQKIEKSDIGLLEFHRTNPHGIKWQVLRDGSTAYIHQNGKLANANNLVASLEVQGLAYDALVMAAELFKNELPEEATHWLDLADRLQQKTFGLFWMEREKFFAMAIDRDDKGQPRQVQTITSVPAELLVSRIFDPLEPEERDFYIESIIKKIYSEEFLTSVGIRCRALKHMHALNYFDYQGSAVSWPVITNIVALGLRKQGYYHLATDLENRMINGANLSGSLSEFFYVDQNGNVVLNPQCHSTLKKPAKNMIYGTNIPEDTQAWTVSAIFRSMLCREINQNDDKPISLREIELGLLALHETSLIEPGETNRIRSSHLSLPINREEAKRREVDYLANEGYL